MFLVDFTDFLAKKKYSVLLPIFVGLERNVILKSVICGKLPPLFIVN